MSAEPFPRGDLADELDLLATGRVEIVGRIPGSSNATFAVLLTAGPREWFAVYKPEAGERPLWDFEPGLYKRERAAFLLSEHLGWGLVPPTVVREDAPVGVGSLQWYIEADAEHYFTLREGAPESESVMRRVALFDYVSNNTDRKSGHVLRDADGRVWAIDHGLCFAAEYKLRTVIWDFAGQPVPGDLLDAVAPLADGVPDELAALLSGHEVRALRHRVRRLLEEPLFPADLTGGYGYPWPLV